MWFIHISRMKDIRHMIIPLRWQALRLLSICPSLRMNTGHGSMTHGREGWIQAVWRDEVAEYWMPVYGSFKLEQGSFVVLSASQHCVCMWVCACAYTSVHAHTHMRIFSFASLRLELSVASFPLARRFSNSNVQRNLQEILLKILLKRRYNVIQRIHEGAWASAFLTSIRGCWGCWCRDYTRSRKVSVHTNAACGKPLEPVLLCW